MDKQSLTTEAAQIHTMIGHQTLPSSRMQLLRRVQSIGGEGMFKHDNQKLNFMKLKKERRVKMGKLFRNSSNEVELFGLRDQNASDKLKQPFVEHLPIEEINYQGLSQNSSIINYSSQVEQQAYFEKIGCNKCHTSLTKVAVPINDSLRNMALAVPRLESLQHLPHVLPPQKNLQPHEPLRRKGLPPIVFQSHLSVPKSISFGEQNDDPHQRYDGQLRFGRIAEGIDQDKLLVLSTQKMLSFMKVERGPKPINHNLSVSKVNRSLIKQVNRVKTFGGGNVLGKAMQQLQQEVKHQYMLPKSIDRSLIKEKERQIDELIFGKSNSHQRTFVTEQKIDMKDFI